MAQNETQNWFFGSNSALYFNSEPPVAASAGSMSNGLGSSSISDGAGNLLFYTNGETVWNAQHQVMLNGTNLGGNQWNSEPLAIRQPGANIYYIFSIGFNSTGLKYSVVDMSLAAGAGSVTTKNISLLTPSEQHLAAI